MHLDLFCLDYNWIILMIQLGLLYYELKNKEDKLQYSPKKEMALGLIARKYNTTETNIRYNFCSGIRFI